MTGVVPQFGATFPYSMFKGFKISPKRVFNAIKSSFVDLQEERKYNEGKRKNFL